jgi:hypothetical protein
MSASATLCRSCAAKIWKARDAAMHPEVYARPACSTNRGLGGRTCAQRSKELGGRQWMQAIPMRRYTLFLQFLCGYACDSNGPWFSSPERTSTRILGSAVVNARLMWPRCDRIQASFGTRSRRAEVPRTSNMGHCPLSRLAQRTSAIDRVYAR